MTQKVQYLDLQGQWQDTTWNEVMESAEKMKNYRDALKQQFWERDELIDDIILSWAARENLLCISPTGSGKTALFNAASSGVEGAKVFSLDLSAYTPETKIFGNYDVRKIRESGQQWHMTEGMLPEANLAQLGEFFDGSWPLLRSLLPALNERWLRNGPQKVRMPLISCLADTNFRPEDVPSRAEKLKAVTDRFLIRREVGYIKDARNDFEAHMAYNRGDFNKPLPPLHLNDIIRVSGVIAGHRPNMLNNKYVVEAYVQLKRELSSARISEGREPLSTRRTMRAQKFIEANALFNGREECSFDDLWAVQSALISAFGDLKVLQHSAEEAVKKWVAKEARHEIETELAEVGKIIAMIPDDADPTDMTTVEIEAWKLEIADAVQALKDFAPDSLEAGTKLRKGLETAAGLRINADMRLLDIVISYLPADPSAVPKDALLAARSELDTAKDILKGISLSDTNVTTKHLAVSERLALAEEIYLRRFADREVDGLMAQWGG